MRNQTGLLLYNNFIAFSQDPFSYLDNTDVVANPELMDAGRSFYSLVRTTSIVVIVVTGVVIAALYASTKDSKKRSDAKDKLIFKFFLLIAIAAFAFIMSTIADIADSFV